SGILGVICWVLRNGQVSAITEGELHWVGGKIKGNGRGWMRCAAKVPASGELAMDTSVFIPAPAPAVIAPACGRPASGYPEIYQAAHRSLHRTAASWDAVAPRLPRSWVGLRLRRRLRISLENGAQRFLPGI